MSQVSIDEQHDGDDEHRKAVRRATATGRKRSKQVRIRSLLSCNTGVWHEH